MTWSIPGGVVGRGRQLAAAEAALTACRAGVRQVLLVGGDAGIGKTTFVAEVLSRAADLSYVVLEGHCLDIAAAIPCGPVVEAVRPLVRACSDDRSRPAARRMAVLLDPVTSTEMVQPSTLVNELVQVVHEAVRYGPVLLLVEDMHWADRSTQDLAVVLSRTTRGPLTLVLTFRDEEITRHHPFRTALGELGRGDGAHRLDLAPLAADDVRLIVEHRSGRPADPAFVMAVHARAEGNPLYVEELLSGPADRISRSLGDLLLSRVDAISEAAREALRAASVDGSRIDSELAARAAGLEPLEWDARLREAMDANITAWRGSHVEFRHGLLREAVYQDLLPASRSRLHAAYAAALQDRVNRLGLHPGMSDLSRLAFHWYEAHDHTAALAANVHAGMAAKRYGAPEAATHFERALELWDLVPGPQLVAGYAQAELVLSLGEVAGDQGDLPRWSALLDRAVSLLEPEGDRLLASRVYSARGALTGAGLLDEKPIAVALDYAEGEPSRELARALVARARLYDRRAAYGAARADAMRAVEVAAAASCNSEEVSSLAELGVVQIMLGRCREGIARLEQAVAAAMRHRLLGEALIQQGQLAWYLMICGELPRARDLAHAGMDIGREAGLPIAATFCGEQEVECLRWMGRFDEADELLGRLSVLGIPAYRSDDLKAGMLVARGEAGRALPLEREIMALRARETERPFDGNVLRTVRLFLMLGLNDEALAVADRYLALVEEGDSPMLMATAARMSFDALVAAQAAGVAPPETLTGRADKARRWATQQLSEEWTTSYYGVELLIANAQAGRLRQSPAVQAWRQAADAAARLGACSALPPRLALAGEILAHGKRDEGRELLIEVWHSARKMGARYVELQAANLAKRTRVPLPVAETEIGPLARLTPRERDVLTVLATGASNKLISERLFISQKTVSIHVSNVLSKLGVTNRGEASALLHLLTSVPTGTTKD